MTRLEATQAANSIGAETETADVDYLCQQLGLPLAGPHRACIESFRLQVWTVAVETTADALLGEQN